MAGKKISAQPTYQDWQRLSLISGHVNELIDDAEGKTLITPLGRMKLNKPQGKSRFAESAPSALGALYKDEILVALPQADDLGESREARLSNLRTHCKNLPAFAWLEKQAGFQAAKQTIAKLGKQYKIASYLKDTADFTLMQAITRPAAWHEQALRVGHSPSYPSREELRKLSIAAKLILDALDQRQFSPHLDVSPWFYKALESFKAELDAKSPGWTKPHSDAALNQSLFQSRIIENLLVKFDHCSPVVVQHISSMFGIDIDDAKVRAVVKGIKASRAKNPKNGHFFT